MPRKMGPLNLISWENDEFILIHPNERTSATLFRPLSYGQSMAAIGLLATKFFVEFKDLQESRQRVCSDSLIKGFSKPKFHDCRRKTALSKRCCKISTELKLLKFQREGISRQQLVKVSTEYQLF